MKDKIITIIFMGYLLFFSIFHIILKDNTISSVERRKLATLPNIEFSSEYIKDIDKYLLDHFPLRNSFRNVKAIYNYYILNKFDNNDIYIKDNYIYKSYYPTNIKSINNFYNKVEKVIDNIPDSNNIYMMIIPDKNYYLEDKNFLQIDYDYIFDYKKIKNIKNIDIRKLLSKNDYYETDTHWKQENLNKIIKEMNKVMSFNYKEINYEKKYYEKFYGVYYGESAINRKPETLTYLTFDESNISVKYLENELLKSIYNINKLTSLDSYEVFLDGASAFIEIENKSSLSNKELVIFRDSFGSSLTPLLVSFYKKIIVIDNRYISSEYYIDKVDFKNKDILFMYSTLLINNSYSLKG